MKTERELYNGLRSVLDAHEKRPFSTIRAAIDQTQAKTADTKTTGKPKLFLARPIRRLAYGAACLVILAVAGLYFLSDFSSPLNAPPLLEESGDISGEIATYGAENGAHYYTPEAPLDENFDAAAVPEMGGAGALTDDLETGSKKNETASLNLSEALQTLLQDYADQPDHVFAVYARSPDERAADDLKQDTTESAAIRYLTAEEICELAGQDYFLDVAPSSSETP